MKLMKTALKYGTVFGAGMVSMTILYAIGAIRNHEEPFLSTNEVLILHGDADKQYKIVAHTGVPEVGDTSMGTIERVN